MVFAMLFKLSKLLEIFRFFVKNKLKEPYCKIPKSDWSEGVV